MARWSIDRGEIERALWASSQGLRAAPGDEVLYRDRMQAHDHAGNLAGVERRSAFCDTTWSAAVASRSPNRPARR